MTTSAMTVITSGLPQMSLTNARNAGVSRSLIGGMSSLIHQNQMKLMKKSMRKRGMSNDYLDNWPKGPTRWYVNSTMYVSVPFTWNLPDLRYEFHQADFTYDRIVVGGPAVKLMPGAFEGMPWVTVQDTYDDVLEIVNPLATKTSTGCINKCKFCAVPRIEGKLVELPSWRSAPVVCDNNLLACSMKHFERVIEDLQQFPWCDFNQGLDARLLTQDHAELLHSLNNPIIRLAYDHTGVPLFQAIEYLRDAGFRKKDIRVYLLIGFSGSFKLDWERCDIIRKAGYIPCPQWYHSLDQLKPNIVTEDQKQLGWNEDERINIMRYYYRRAGVNRATEGDEQ